MIIPPIYRMIEVIVYSLLNFLPFLFLALYPFAGQHRFGTRGHCILISVITCVQICFGLLSAFSSVNPGNLSAFSTLTYVAFFLLSVKSRPGKLIFTLLMLSNLANLVVMCSKCLEGLIFGEALARESHRFSNSVTMLIFHLLISLPLFFYIRKWYCEAMRGKNDSPAWNYLWLIPATFYLLWYHHIYGGEESSLDIALQPQHTLFLLAINMGAFLVYHMVIRLILEQEQNSLLEYQNHQLTVQNLQYENLREHIEETRHARHDIRHHVAVLMDCLERQEYDRLKEYLQGYMDDLPDISHVSYCSNHTVNTVLSYFAQTAKQKNIAFDVSVTLSPEISLPDRVLSVILGNLLENAVAAAESVTDRPAQITVSGKSRDGAVFFKIDNTYSGELKYGKNGQLLSTKQKGQGIGLSSVRHIVQQHDGLMEISQDRGIFSVSVFLDRQSDSD